MRARTKFTPVLADASAEPYNPWLWHKNYKVQWKDRQGNLQPVPVQQTVGSRCLAHMQSSNQLQVPIVLFTKDKEEEEEVPRELEEQMFKQVFYDVYPCLVQNPNPSDSPSVHICLGFTKAQQLAEENKKPANIYPLSLQILAPYYAYPNVSPHTPPGITLLTLLPNLNPNHARPTLCCPLNKLNLTYSCCT